MIAVGIPWQHEHIPTRFMLDLLASDLKTDSVIVIGNVGDTAQNRNQIVRRAMLIGAECVYFLDVDQGIPTDIRKRLGSHEKKIVSAIAPRRDGKHMLAYRRVDNMYRPVNPSGLEKVDGIGFGCVRVDMEVFLNVPSPWFENRYDNYGNMIFEHDLYFCAKAKMEGYEIWVDGGLNSDHYSIQKAVVGSNRGWEQTNNLVPVMT